MAFKREKALAAAQKYASKGQHDKAAREYQAVVDNDPKDLRAWLMLAGALQKAGKNEDALARYLQVAKSYHEQKEYSKALAVYRQALGIDPRRIDVHLRCAQLHAELRQIPEAVDIYEKVGKVYLKQGRPADAIELFKTVADLDPTAVTRRLRLAELYSREKMNDQAVAAFRVAGQSLLEAEKFDEYVRVAERLLYHKSDDRETILGVVRAYIKLRQPRRALIKLNGLLQKDPGDVEGLELLCETFVRLGKVDKAVSVTLEIVREHTDDTEAGQALARRVLERALEWAPKNADLKAAYAPFSPDAQVDDDADTRAIDLGDDFGDEFGQDSDDDAQELDLDADDVVELDEDDVVEELTDFEELEEYDDFAGFEDEEQGIELEADDAPGIDQGIELDDDEDEFADAALDDAGTTAAARAPTPSTSDPADVDLDRQLQEARVLAKYRLYDNALAHLDEVLEGDPRHLGALELRVDILERAKRDAPRADALVALGKVLAGSDPSRASACAREALEVVAGHAEAQALLRDIGPDTVMVRSPLAPEPAEPENVAPVESGVLSPDDETAFVDLVDEEGSEDYIELPSPEESHDFSIDLDDDDDEDEDDDEPGPIEDRFGLPEESAELPIGGIADISDEVEDIESLLAMGREQDAKRAFLALAASHAGHPALSSISEHFDDVAQREPPSDSIAATPLLDLDEDDEAEDYLANIFDDEDDEPASPKKVKHRGRAQVEGGEADAATHYDLGTAYLGMGLRDDALRELELAAKDPGWTCRACILMGTVHQQLAGDDEAAAAAIERAVEAAEGPDETSESNYLLGELRLKAGDTEAAREAFERVAPGFRDREAKLAIL